MRSVTIAVLLATAACAAALNPLDLVEDLIASPSEQDASSLPPPPVKLDKNLRRALLKALVDLEAESAEQQNQSSTDNPTTTLGDDAERPTERPIDETKYDFLEISRQKSATFSFDGFPAEEDIPSEDKLQNSSFVETDKFVAGDEPAQSGKTQPPKDYTKGVQVHHVVPSEKNSIYETKPAEQLESVESRSIASSVASAPGAELSVQKSVSLAPITETLSASASGNVASAAANSLLAPRPTVATNLPGPGSNGNKNATSAKSAAGAGSKIAQPASGKPEAAEDVKIFQAPLVAAFTVQQDERGVPKSVVPLYKIADGPAQPLSLQEQLDFKQRLLEKQLAQLQAQQAQQTHFLLRQRQAYEEQLRQKQQDYFLQEQRRLKLLQEQEHQQRLLQQQRLQQQQFQRLPQQAFQQLQPFQQQPPFPQQQQQFKTTTSVHLQPSLALEVPSTLPGPVFQPHRHQQQQQQQQQQQASFSGFAPVDFQQPPSPAPLARFNRQEAFDSIANFGFNNNFQSDNKLRSGQFQQQTQNGFVGFAGQQFARSQQRQAFPQATPAHQIQELLFQSGIAGDLQGAGTRNQEDLNIVSKVLALNVGALPAHQRTKSFQQQQQQQHFGLLKK